MKNLSYAVMLVVSSLALGQTAQKPAENRVTRVEFDDDLVPGTLYSPDIGNISARSAPAHQNLIQIRDNFRDEVLKSAAEL